MARFANTLCVLALSCVFLITSVNQPAIANAGPLVQVALRVFLEAITSRVLNQVIDRVFLDQQAHLVQINVEKEKAITELMLTRLQRLEDEALGQGPRRPQSKAIDLEGKLNVLDETEEFIREFRNYVKSRSKNDAELRQYCLKHIESTIRPLIQRLEDHEVRIASTERRLVEHASRLGSVEKRQDALDSEISNVKHDIDELRHGYNVKPTLGVHYYGHNILSHGWSSRFGGLAQYDETSSIFSGLGVSGGIWISHFFHADISVDYLFAQRVLTTAPYEIIIEGFGWSGRGIMTIQTAEHSFYEVGAGYSWHNHGISYESIAFPIPQGESRKSTLRQQSGTPIVVLGFRGGRSDFLLSGHIEFLVNTAGIDGYNLRIGMMFTTR